MIEKVIEQFQRGAAYEISTDVQPDPSRELVDRGAKKMLESGADLIVAFGGGSAIDAAKAMIHTNLSSVKRSDITFVAIPTTAGTGSEVTNFSVVTCGTEKTVIISDDILPDCAILDPTFTKSVPPAITVDTGMDVLTHALEAYISNRASVYTDVLAQAAVEMVLEHLPIVAEDGLRMRSRAAMMEASCMAGMAFTNAGLGINHSLAHILGGTLHIPHGRVNAMLLPRVMRFQIARSEEAKKKLDRLAERLGKRNAEEFLEDIECLSERLGLPKCLSDACEWDAAAYENRLNEMANVAMNDRCTATNPATVTPADLRNLLRDIQY